MNHKQILTDQIADHQKAIDEAKSKIDELEKPEKNCADCKYGKTSCTRPPCGACWDSITTKPNWTPKDTKPDCPTCKHEFEAKVEELRHGDYGFDRGGRPCMAVYKWNEGMVDMGPDHTHTTFEGFNHVETILGNIFDDLDAPDLEEFNMANTAVKLGAEIKLGELGGAGVRLLHRTSNPWSWFNLKNIIEYHRKLGQLIRTAIKKQANNG